MHKDSNWDAFINDDHVLQKMESLAKTLPAGDRSLISAVQAPLGNQELWACGVTYLRSKIGRQEESKAAGGGDFMPKYMKPNAPKYF